jgi:lysophospholipase L1-like esterase
LLDGHDFCRAADQWGNEEIGVAFQDDEVLRTSLHEHIPIKPGIGRQQDGPDLRRSARQSTQSCRALIQGHRQIIDRAHALGLKVYGGTLNPVEGYPFPGLWSPDPEEKRQAVNRWIRTSKAYDAVIDFDKVLRDPSHPTRLLPDYDSGDHVHPNDTGYRVMADAIDLSLFCNEDED